MNIAVVCLSDDKKIMMLGKAFAKVSKTRTSNASDFDPRGVIDLLFIGFNCDQFNITKKIDAFISELDRSFVHNVALFGMYTFNTRAMEKAITSCQKADLPLMREQYTCHVPLICHKLPHIILQDSRAYIEDMISIVDNYY